MLAVDKTDPNAGSWENLLGIDLHWDLERLKDPRGRVGSLGRVHDSFEQDRELVAPDPEWPIGGNLLQYEIAGAVAKTVVDGFEVVQVDKQDGDIGQPSLSTSERMLDTI